MTACFPLYYLFQRLFVTPNDLLQRLLQEEKHFLIVYFFILDRNWTNLQHDAKYL